MIEPYLYAHHHTTTDQGNPGRLTHIHNHVEMVYCRGGEGYQITPEGLKFSRKGDLFCFLPGVPHLSYCQKNQAMDMIVVYFDEVLFRESPPDREWYGNLRRRWEKSPTRRLVLTPEGRRRSESLMMRIVDEFGRSRPGAVSMASSCLTQLLLELYRQDETGESDEEESVLSPRERIAHLLLYLEVNYQIDMSVEFARDFCHVSRSRFHSLFKEETGMGFTEYLNRLRIDKAGSLLVSDRELAVLDAAESCGFNEISHFCHLFRRFKGCSPRQWRNRIGKDTERPQRLDSIRPT